MIRRLRILSLTLFAASSWAIASDPTQTVLIQQLESRRGLPASHLDADSVHSYDQVALSLDYRVDPNGVPMTGFTSIRLVARAALSAIPLNAEAMTVIGVNHNDQAIPFSHINDTLYVFFPMLVGDTVTLDFQVSVPASGNSGSVGYHSDWNHAYTFSEPYGARLWFPCYDQPYDKFNEVTIAVNMPDHWSLAANGALIETTYPSQGRKREVYHHDHPITTYLVMLAAGEYSKRYETADGVQFRYFTFPEDSAMATYDWQRTPQMTSIFSGLFGSYPFDQYGMVQASIMNGWGAMEHQTFTTYGRWLVDGNRTFEGIVAHELAHMWFGDAVTCIDFRNIWLNEGFATYSDALFFEAVEGQEVFENIMANFGNDYLSNSNLENYATYDPPPDLLFSALVYQKAAWTLHMLRQQLLGDSLFFSSLQTYLDLYSGGHANTEEFIEVVNQVAGQDLDWFFNQWIYQPGHPVLRILIQPRVPTTSDVTVTVIQDQTNGVVYRFPLSLNVRTSEGTTRQMFWFDQANQSVTHSFPTMVLQASLSIYQPVLFENSSQATPETPEIPLKIGLGSPYPNPFNSTVRIPFKLDRDREVRLSIYDIQGRLISTLREGRMKAGEQEVVFAAERDLANGVYFVTLATGSTQQTAKILFLK